MIGHVLASGGSGVGAGVGLLFILGIVCYFIPAIIAGIRHVPSLGSVIVINFFLAGHLSDGW
jgi:hypothetical protein